MLAQNCPNIVQRAYCSGLCIIAAAVLVRVQAHDGSFKKMLRAACDASGAAMVTAEVKFPIR